MMLTMLRQRYRNGLYIPGFAERSAAAGELYRRLLAGGAVRLVHIIHGSLPQASCLMLTVSDLCCSSTSFSVNRCFYHKGPLVCAVFTSTILFRQVRFQHSWRSIQMLLVLLGLRACS